MLRYSHENFVPYASVSSSRAVWILIPLGVGMAIFHIVSDKGSSAREPATFALNCKDAILLVFRRERLVPISPISRQRGTTLSAALPRSSLSGFAPRAGKVCGGNDWPWLFAIGLVIFPTDDGLGGVIAIHLSQSGAAHCDGSIRSRICPSRFYKHRFIQQLPNVTRR
jgi:hypothetical protein